MNQIDPKFLARSREVFTSNSQATLLELLAAIKSDAEIDSIRQRDLISALNHIEGWFGRQLDAVPANPRALRLLFASAPAAKIGVSEKTFANVRSLVGNAARRYGTGQVQLTKRIPLASKWRHLLDQIAVIYMRHALFRLATFCSEMDIPPAGVDRGTLVGLHAALEVEELVKQPRSIIKNTIGAWNRCRKQIPDWPPVQLGSPFKVDPVTLPLSAFPLSFRQHIVEWVARVTDQDELNEGVPDFPLSDPTVELRIFQIRQFATALVKSGAIVIDDVTSLAVLFTPDRFKVAMKWFLNRPHDKESRRLYFLAGAMMGIAKHHCKIDQSSLAAMAAIRKKLAPRTPRQMPARYRARIRQLDDPGNVRRLLRFAEEQIRMARGEENRLRAAKRVEIALAVKLMMHGGLRQATLRKLYVTGDFSWTRPNYQGICHLHVPAEKIKNKRPAERELPPDVAEILRLYLVEYRPSQPGAQGPYLFPGATGGMRARSQFAAGISGALRRDAGLDLNPHLIRHAVAKIAVEQDPGAYFAVSRVLGHTTMNTTLAHYLGTETNAVAKRFDEALNSASELPVSPPRAPSKPRKR